MSIPFSIFLFFIFFNFFIFQTKYDIFPIFRRFRHLLTNFPKYTSYLYFFPYPLNIFLPTFRINKFPKTKSTLSKIKYQRISFSVKTPQNHLQICPNSFKPPPNKTLSIYPLTDAFFIPAHSIAQKTYTHYSSNPSPQSHHSLTLPS